MKIRIGELLIQYGIITESQLKEALSIQKGNKKRLGEILLELGYLSTADLILVLSEQSDIPFIKIDPEMLNHELINRFPEKVLYENTVLPLYETDEAVFVAQGDPTDSEKTNAVQACVKKKIIVSGADPVKIEHLLNKFKQIRQNDVSSQKSRQKTFRIKSEDAQIEWISEKKKATQIRGKIDIMIKYTDKQEKKND